MSTIATLEVLREFLLEKVTPTIKLQKANDTNIREYELVSPQVHIGWIPPKGYLTEGMESTIPCLIVGMEDGSDDGQSSDINIRISAAIFSPGLHEPKGDRVKYTPDFQGYIDLMNLIDRTKAELLKNPIIKNSFSVQESVKWGMYQDQPYPYWYGWITFSIKKQAYSRSEILKNL
ncbi:hypothetical protein E4K67_17450 [Desulfosporosinus fructosivorans]|uniref:Uncharacterized protein n=1 Tax=Desulfosporosinus fructosivorans TaxID=2018669 RepID=A0A4Z0R3C7_9FIRM|nr:hypothetical protein [Desulfosporosinus fructosivorans]TGE36885.1 hypothetical protein E4K67_17450 [Desulfosporosinus fructosivorans]